MNIVELQSQLSACLASQNISMQNAVGLADGYTVMLRKAQVSPEEYQQLLRDIQSSVAIYQDMIELDIKDQFNSIITQMIDAATSL